MFRIERFRIEEVRDLARDAVAVLDPARLEGRDAARLAEAAAEGAKLLSAASVLLAKRAADTDAWRHRSHAASVEQWLAEASGCTEGAAREALHTAQRVERLPTTAEHLRSGGLSVHAVRVRVDLPALLRGRTEPGELCEIPGVGPVPVAHAEQVLSHGLLQLVITDGVDVQTVISNTRHVPAALKIAIAERDRTCKVRGCDHDRALERHHTHEFSESKRTTYRELGNLCPQHHDLVTHRGHQIIDHHDGTWDLRAPPPEAAA